MTEQEWIARKRLTPNRSPGGYPVEGVVYHYTASGDFEGTARWLCSPESRVSAHFLIGHDGETLQLAPLSERTWHAGRAQFLGTQNVNQRTIGIELVNYGPLLRNSRGEFNTIYGQAFYGGVQECPAQGGYRFWARFPEAQMVALEVLVMDLVQRYPALRDCARHVGHSDIAPKRKLDPGPAFDWARIYRLVGGA